MRVLVFGANGKTGALLVERALAAGYEVSVFVRDAAKYVRRDVRVLQGNGLNVEDVRAAMADQDAVLDSIGGTTPWKSTTLETDVARNIVAAMQETGTGRVLVVSAMGVGESYAQGPWWYRSLMLHTFLRGSTADKTTMEAVVRASGLAWVIARPPILRDGSGTGSVRVLGAGETGHGITRADLADWLVKQLQSDVYVGHAVTVVNT